MCGSVMPLCWPRKMMTHLRLRFTQKTTFVISLGLIIRHNTLLLFIIKRSLYYIMYPCKKNICFNVCLSYFFADSCVHVSLMSLLYCLQCDFLIFVGSVLFNNNIWLNVHRSYFLSNICVLNLLMFIIYCLQYLLTSSNLMYDSKISPYIQVLKDILILLLVISRIYPVDYVYFLMLSTQYVFCELTALVSYEYIYECQGVCYLVFGLCYCTLAFMYDTTFVNYLRVLSILMSFLVNIYLSLVYFFVPSDCKNV